MTRAEVKARLVQVEQAGYNPAMGRTTYPAEIQKAEAKVAVQQGQNSKFGDRDNSSASGSYRGPDHVENTRMNPLYRAH